MDNLHVRVGDVLRGQWTLAEFSSPVSYGALFIRNFTIEKIDADSKGRVRFHLMAENLFYTSIEGWTVPIWDFREVDRIRKEDAGEYREQIVQKTYDLTMVMWENGYSEAMKKDITTIASRKHFILSKKNLVMFMSRHDKNASAYLEEKKIETMLNLPETAFKGGDAKGLQQQIQKRWKNK
jgi:hypothetical protein